METPNGDTGADTNDETPIQEMLTEALPELPEDRITDPPEDETGTMMSRGEQQVIHETFDGMVRELYDKGYTPNELSIILDTLSHRVNAARFDKHEYDRIALTMKLRETIETWRESQDTDIPDRVVAETVEELGRLYRTQARKNHHKTDAEDANGDEE